MVGVRSCSGWGYDDTAELDPAPTPELEEEAEGEVGDTGVVIIIPFLNEMLSVILSNIASTPSSLNTISIPSSVSERLRTT
jgi:hypothetical protein